MGHKADAERENEMIEIIEGQDGNSMTLEQIRLRWNYITTYVR